MLNITKQSENGKAVINLSGDLDTLTADELRNEVDGFLEGVTDMTLDLEGLDYITSAGLRVILDIQKTMDNQGEMRVLHVCEDVMDVFELSGFTKILTIE